MLMKQLDQDTGDQAVSKLPQDMAGAQQTAISSLSVNG
jgi:hypothetical protein